MTSEGPAPGQPAQTHTRAEPAASELTPAPTRTSAAWSFAALGALVVVLMLVFILQNGQRANLEFLWFDFHLPTGVALLLAGAIGALVVVLAGASRLLQLRVAARRHRRQHRAADATE